MSSDLLCSSSHSAGGGAAGADDQPLSDIQSEPPVASSTS